MVRLQSPLPTGSLRHPTDGVPGSVAITILFYRPRSRICHPTPSGVDDKLFLPGVRRRQL